MVCLIYMAAHMYRTDKEHVVSVKEEQVLETFFLRA